MAACLCTYLRLDALASSGHGGCFNTFLHCDSMACSRRFGESDKRQQPMTLYILIPSLSLYIGTCNIANKSIAHNRIINNCILSCFELDS